MSVQGDRFQMPRADIKMRSINISDVLGHLSLLIYMFEIIYPLGCFMPLTKGS